MKVLFLFILPVSLVISGLNFAFQAMGWPALNQIVGILTVVGFYWIFEVALFLRFRYRANRTSWRGIRARVSGNALHFAGWALLLAAGVALTAGILYPYAHAFFMRYKLNCLSFGGLKVQSTFSSSTIYGRFILCAVAVPLISIPTAFIIGLIIGSIIGSSRGIGLPLGTFQFPYQFIGVIFIPIAFLGFAWYWAKLYQEAAKSVWIGDQKIDVSYNITGWRLARYVAGNWAIIIFSLGLRWPLTWIRKLDLICECLTIHKEIPVEAMMQEAHDPTHVGEELGGGFDIA